MQVRSLFGVLLLCLTLGMAAGATETNQRQRANAVVATTGLVSLPLNHQLRVSVVDAGICKAPLPVRVRVLDAHGAVLLDQPGVVGPNQPLLVELARDTAALTQPALVSAEVTVGPKQPINAPPCPMNITVQTVAANDTSAGPILHCTIDPCLLARGSPNGSPNGSPGNLVADQRCLPGPPRHFGPQANCSTLDIVLPVPTPGN